MEPLREKTKILAEIDKLAEASRKVKLQLDTDVSMPHAERAKLMGLRRVYASQRSALEAKLGQLKADHAELFERRMANELASLRRQLYALSSIWRAQREVHCTDCADELEAVLRGPE